MFRTESPFCSPPSKFPPAGKRSPASSKTLTLLSRSFDETLLRRLKTLDPPSISLSWLSRAVDFLSSTHADAETLISDLKLSAPEEPLASYLDESVKVLDVCNSISAEIEKLRHGRLLIHFFLHLLKVSDGDRKIPAPENLNRARVSLADYKKCSATERKRSLETPAVLIREQIWGLGNPPRGKISTVEKLLRRTIYAVGAVTVFVTGAVVTILDGSTETAGADVSGDFLWAEEFNRLRSAFAGSISKRFSGEKKRFAEEVEALEAGVKEIGDIITDVSETDAERFYIAVKGLERLTEAYALGLDRLLNGVNGFFRGVLCARNSLLHNYR